MINQSDLDCIERANRFFRSSSTRVEDYLALSSQLHDHNSKELATLSQRVHFVEKGARIHRSASGNLALPFNENGSVMSRLDLASTTWPFTAGSSTEMTLVPASSALSAVQTDTRRASDPLDYFGTVRRSEKCIGWCSCVCHTQSSIRSPWFLKTVMGVLVIEYTGKGPSCDEHSCRGSRTPSTSINMTYHLPPYLMNRYVAMLIKYTSVDGPKFSLRLPRMMDWQHSLFKHANHGDLEAIQSLFSQGRASPHDVNPCGTNALTYAATHGHPQLGKFLLQHGADAELADNYGRKPIDLYWERAFSGQFKENDYQTVKSMFEDNDYVENRHFTVVHKIVLGILPKDLESELLGSTATIDNVDAQGRTALSWSCIRDDSSAVNILLKFGADPNIADMEGNTCLHFARSKVVCKSLLNHNADVHARNTRYSRSPLHNACKREGTAELIELLVHAGLDVNHRDADGETPLLNAIFRRNTAAVQKLIELGADVNAANYSSRDAAIHFAVEFDHHEILALLLEKGADHSATNARGRTIGHLAARTAGVATTAILSKAKLKNLDLSLRDENGRTAADHLAQRRLRIQSESEIHGAFEKLVQSIHGDSSPGEKAPEFRVIDFSGTNGAKAHSDSNSYYGIPGAYPKDQYGQDISKEEARRESIVSFRCDYKSSCCHIFDAPRGVCSGVISYQNEP